MLLVDESSMIPTPDLADLVSLAEVHRAKMVLAGDTGQLQAVENGGGMSLLAGTLGYVRSPILSKHRSGQPRCGLTRPAWK